MSNENAHFRERNSPPLFGAMSAKRFLSQYWQKQPLWIPGLLKDWMFDITPEELAGLACEEDVRSRIISTDDQHTRWKLDHGPFDEEVFTTAPDNNWTLLVQDIGKLLPEWIDLVTPFIVAPYWRFDDLMLSYASPNGSVGPHTDAYDVFLIQASGRRKWQIGNIKTSPEYLAHPELKILSSMNIEAEYIAEPGDVLYLPPNVPHYGTALDDCITCSVGFRAPTLHDILVSFVESRVASLDDQQLFQGVTPSDTHPFGEIQLGDLQLLHKTITDALMLPMDDIATWFGKFVTASDTMTDTETNELNPLTLHDVLLEQPVVYRDTAHRIQYIQTDENASLFVNGKHYNLLGHNDGFCEYLADRFQYQTSKLSEYMQDKTRQTVLMELFNQGTLYFPEEEND